MKDFKGYITEKLKVDKNVKTNSEETTAFNKLVYSLKKIFNDKLTVSTDYQGDKDKESSWYYEINPETLGGGTGNGYTAEKFVKYCKKIDALEIEEKNGDSLSKPTTKIGKGRYWVKIIWGGYRLNGVPALRAIRISKDFYEDCPFEKDQSNVAQRGWNRWAGKAW